MYSTRKVNSYHDSITLSISLLNKNTIAYVTYGRAHAPHWLLKRA